MSLSCKEYQNFSICCIKSQLILLHCSDKFELFHLADIFCYFLQLLQTVFVQYATRCHQYIYVTLRCKRETDYIYHILVWSKNNGLIYDGLWLPTDPPVAGVRPLCAVLKPSSHVTGRVFPAGLTCTCVQVQSSTLLLAANTWPHRGARDNFYLSNYLIINVVVQKYCIHSKLNPFFNLKVIKCNFKIDHFRNT